MQKMLKRAQKGLEGDGGNERGDVWFPGAEDSKGQRVEAWEGEDACAQGHGQVSFTGRRLCQRRPFPCS